MFLFKRHRPSSMLHITEDTPADMLSGAMDLTIHLPSGNAARMCVERSTPMMDLLVQITTNHQLQITNYTLQPLQTAPDTSYPEKLLSYYPNTPIGALDTQHVRLIPKTRSIPAPKNVPPGHQPFESTFRLKVHLPRNQLYVTRVSRHVHIEDIMRKVCEEKNLEPDKYEVRHPGNLDEILDTKLTLNDYMITEIYLILKDSNISNQIFTANNIMTLRKGEERKQMHSKTGGGVFNLIFRRGKTNNVPAANSATESISLTYNENPRPLMLPVTPHQNNTLAETERKTGKPKAPQRKRRPAPKPPQLAQKPTQTIEKTEEPSETEIRSAVSNNSATRGIGIEKETGITICHSRHSSDSSGYHETSVLSDHCNTSLPRGSRLEERQTTQKSLNRLSESIGNLTKLKVQSRSTSSLALPGRRKRAAPPPPTSLQKSTSSETNFGKPIPVVASHTPVNSSASIPESISSVDHLSAQNKSNSNIAVDISNEASSIIEGEMENIKIIPRNFRAMNSYTDIRTNGLIMNELDRYNDDEKSAQDSGNSSDISEKSKIDSYITNEELVNATQELEIENEEWQLPSPPKAFKDDNSIFQDNTYEAAVLDSVITPEVLEKLKQIEDKQASSEDEANHHGEERRILNKLSLQNLEKRKSLVYNRELATSLKLSYNSNSHQQNNPLSNRFQSDLDISASSNQFEKTLEGIPKSEQKNIERSEKLKSSLNQSTLPNFKISTYDGPKQKITVFEDDTIRSNSDRTGNSITLNRTQSFENISFRQNNTKEIFRRPIEHRMFIPKNEHYRRKSVNRSESFSTDQNEWSPSKPVTRSKSQVAIKRAENYNDSLQPDNIFKSSSLFDVSGLQSLEVMRKIQNKLNTPATSMETLTKIEIEKDGESSLQAEEVQEVDFRKLKHSGPPTINMGTWSDRPRAPVIVKADTDYELNKRNNKNVNSKTTVKVETDSSERENGELKHRTSNGLYCFPHKTEYRNVAIKLSGSDLISTQKNGNVLIKIGEQNTRLQEFNDDVIYQHSLDHFNKKSARPHSIAFSSDFDFSRVPVVRSVELKKTFRDNSNKTSVARTIQPSTICNTKKISEHSEYLGNKNSTENSRINNISKPLTRAVSFTQPNPVVMGFRNVENTYDSNYDSNIKKVIKHSWQPNSSKHLPCDTSEISVVRRETYTTNQNLPFSKFNLRRIESNNITDDERSEYTSDGGKLMRNKFSPAAEPLPSERNKGTSEFSVLTSKVYEKPDSVVPPPPPQMPKMVQKKISYRQLVPVLDPRDELLKSIRSFGGKKGLRSRKA